MNSYHTNKFQKNKKISVGQMWSVIEEVLTPWDSVPDKTKMNDEQVLKLYYIIKEADEMFRMLAQIAELRKAIDELAKKQT
ncbi:MAG TPA: hypothetical protein VGR54_02080 [Nitrosopumilaceae archaeon]|nr:hypothetical protein [Nitrosopumilaceae archaeon]